MQGSPYVLIVDDEPAVRNIIADIVLEEGVEAVQAVDGLEALWYLERTRLLRRHLPSAITLDMMMPRMNGLIFLQEAKQAGFETIPVVVCSATLHVHAHKVRSDPQVCAHIAKPFDLDTLLSSIQNAILLSETPKVEQEHPSLPSGWVYSEPSKRWTLRLPDLKAVIVDYPDLPHPRRYLAYILTPRQSLINTVAALADARHWIEQQIVRLNKG